MASPLDRMSGVELTLAQSILSSQSAAWPERIWACLSAPGGGS